MTSSSRFSLSLNGEFWLACLLVVFTTVSIRLTELPLWLNEAFMVSGEHLMATHDAYVWLAGVKGIGNFINDPFTRILSLLHNASGIPLASIGFWSPIIFIPLLAVPVCLLARFLRLPEGGLVFGILATAGLGFLVRTRLGFCDTDIVNLIFPVAMVSTLALWLDGMDSANRTEDAARRYKQMGWALLVGILGKMSVYVYPGSSSILLPAFGLAVLIGLWRSHREDRFLLGNGLLLIFAVLFAGWQGGLLVGAWAIWVMIKKDMPAGVQFGGIAVLFVAVIFLGNFFEIVQALVYRLYLYTKVGTPDMISNATGFKLPDIAQSVREAQNLDWTLIGPRLGGNWVVFVLGMLGFGFVAWRRHALLVFLPFLALGIASVKFGNRFAMYGTVGVGMGLGLGLSEFLQVLGQSQGRRWIAQLVMACVVLWPSAVFMQEVGPVPVLPRTYAETFVELRDATETDALLWQWWDYGYAGQYYAERATFGDGSRQSGPWLYPLARVHCAASPREAAQLIRYFGQAMLDSGSMNNTDARTALFRGNPVTEIREMDLAQAQKFLSDLVVDDANWPTTMPNYFIVSWENLRLASWISYYGNWDIASGTSAPGKIQQVRGEVRMDSAAGTLVVGGKSTLLDSMDVVEDSGTRHFEWPNGTGMHVVVNQMSRQVFLMDAKMYRSMMVQMLLRPASDFAEEFTLVVDNSPWTRTYKVR
ncbi:dolichyl-diphosphooligosaccharide--protein glycosyltransferase [Desulfomicrobium apsheronum]|uniref:Dolichyl-diphosphooligosaccharide--protein glycosyltransferase n=1 Tax=Desulfomicrobium apsheronum TaxID=52560 RepID=A0A1I3N911_9BACT|nr:STT3 domain-containing protein [Desulfomicrobium apsheronum]SFJ05811.1 dolichyl-diphosphooligosaccharide--protein glycosyltransferase [Desulfomicrobium apsheronum]